MDRYKRRSERITRTDNVFGMLLLSIITPVTCPHIFAWHGILLIVRMRCNGGLAFAASVVFGFIWYRLWIVADSTRQKLIQPMGSPKQPKRGEWCLLVCTAVDLECGQEEKWVWCQGLAGRKFTYLPDIVRGADAVENTPVRCVFFVKYDCTHSSGNTFKGDHACLITTWTVDLKYTTQYTCSS